MTDLVLSEDRKQFQDLARDFAQNEIAPNAHRFDHSPEFPLDLCKKAWEIGLFNVRFPEEYGGLALGAGDAAVIAEELGAGCAGISSPFWGNDLAVAPVMVAGTDAQKDQYLAPFGSTFGLAAYCFDLSHHSTVEYTAKGDQFILSGKAAAINAGHAEWLFVVAHEKGKRSASTALVIPLQTEGLKVEASPPALGIKAADLSTVHFHQVNVPVSNKVGTTGDASSLMKETAAWTGTIIASCAVGVARTALECSVRYSKERYTMGQPIANHQAVGFMLADMAKDIEAARLMIRKAAWLADAGEPNSSASLMAKSFAVDMAMKAATDAVQVYGGYGYSREYPVEKLMRDAKMLQVYVGESSGVQLQVGRQFVDSVL